MSQLYARPLNEKSLVERFLKNCLNYNNSNKGDITLKILKEEMLIENVPQHFSTLKDVRFRHPDYSEDAERARLRETIFKELFTQVRLEDDTLITLGNGGCRPKDVKKERKAFLITGLPASGKSTIAIKIADAYGAYIIDSDYAKLKLPEFTIFGANTVHRESGAIMRGSPHTANEKNLREACIFSKANVVIPTIGQSIDDVTEERDLLISKGYEVHLLLVSVKREIATIRALNRYLMSQRYVPLSLIFDGYANDPVLTYHRIKADAEWTSYGKINTEKDKPLFIEASLGSPAYMFKCGG